MKIFDFLVKITIFWAFLFFLGDLRHALRRNRTLDRGKTRDTNLPKKRRNAQKMVILTKKSKNFIKAKNDGLQKLYTWAPRFYDFLHFKG